MCSVGVAAAVVVVDCWLKLGLVAIKLLGAVFVVTKQLPGQATCKHTQAS